MQSPAVGMQPWRASSQKKFENVSEGGLGPRPWWYIPKRGIHHHSKLTRQGPAGPAFRRRIAAAPPGPHDQPEHLTCRNDDHGRPESGSWLGPGAGIRAVALRHLAGTVTASRCCRTFPYRTRNPREPAQITLATELNPHEPELNPHKAVEAAGGTISLTGTVPSWPRRNRSGGPSGLGPESGRRGSWQRRCCHAARDPPCPDAPRPHRTELARVALSFWRRSRSAGEMAPSAQNRSIGATATPAHAYERTPCRAKLRRIPTVEGRRQRRRRKVRRWGGPRSCRSTASCRPGRGSVTTMLSADAVCGSGAGPVRHCPSLLLRCAWTTADKRWYETLGMIGGDSANGDASGGGARRARASERCATRSASTERAAADTSRPTDQLVLGSGCDVEAA